MITFSQLYKNIVQNGGRVYMYDIGFAEGATIAKNAAGPYGVFLDFSLAKSARSLKACLAHESGHCATGALHALTSPFELVEKNEYKANRWAFNEYLPYKKIKAALCLGYTEPWQLAEYFDLPEDFIKKALTYYTQNRGLSFNN